MHAPARLHSCCQRLDRYDALDFDGYESAMREMGLWLVDHHADFRMHEHGHGSGGRGGGEKRRVMRERRGR